jgi:hypothetical protein
VPDDNPPVINTSLELFKAYAYSPLSRAIHAASRKDGGYIPGALLEALKIQCVLADSARDEISKKAQQAGTPAPPPLPVHTAGASNRNIVGLMQKPTPTGQRFNTNWSKVSESGFLPAGYVTFHDSDKGRRIWKLPDGKLVSGADFTRALPSHVVDKINSTCKSATSTDTSKTDVTGGGLLGGNEAEVKAKPEVAENVVEILLAENVVEVKEESVVEVLAENVTEAAESASKQETASGKGSMVLAESASKQETASGKGSMVVAESASKQETASGKGSMVLAKSASKQETASGKGSMVLAKSASKQETASGKGSMALAEIVAGPGAATGDPTPAGVSSPLVKGRANSGQHALGASTTQGAPPSPRDSGNKKNAGPGVRVQRRLTKQDSLAFVEGKKRRLTNSEGKNGSAPLQLPEV